MSGIHTVLASVFLVAMMLSIGLQVRLREMVSEVRKYRLVAKALLANLVIVPLAGVAVAALFHLKGDVAAGFLLLALAPGAPFATNFTSKTEGGLQLAASLLFVLVVAAVIYTPLVANLVLQLDTHVSLQYAHVAGRIIALLVLPFVVGLALKNRLERASAGLCKAAMIVAILAFVSFMLLSVAAGKQARSEIGGHTVLAMVVFIAIAMLVGWLIGGPERGNRQVMAVGTSMRNVAVALLLVQSMGSETARLTVVAFFSLMVPCNLFLTVYENVKQKRKAA